MLKFLKIFKGQEVEIEIESMRSRFERVTSELNDVLSELDELPAFKIDPSGKRIHFDAPEQFSDEALALPKPTEEENASDPSVSDQSDSTEQDAQADQKTAA